MKIAFVNDSCERLGVEYISAVLKTGGHTVKLFIDPQLFDDVYISFRSLNQIFDYKKIVARALKFYKPDLICISTDSEHYQWACTIAKMIKEEMDVPIIFGGIHPTSVPERVIKNDFVDMVCVGEGEYPMLELANSMEKGSIDYSIKNIWFKRNGQVIQNEVRPLIEDLDSLPMPDKDLYYSASPHFKKGYCISTNRGCLYTCSYCCHSYLHELYQSKGNYLRQRSVSNVIQELIKAKLNYRINLVIFFDDCFGYNIDWLREFSYEYRKKIGIRFRCSLHPSHISEDSVKYLKSAGCQQITLGIQTWNQNIREHLLNRYVSNDVMLEAIRLVKKEKIDLLVDNIFGFPIQDDEDYIQSTLFYTRMKPHRILFYRLKYYPNTAITRKAKQNNMISMERFEEILDGKNERGVYLDSFFCRQSKKNGKSVKMQILFVIMDLFPRKIMHYIIRKRLYRYFPGIINPAVLVSLRTMLSSDLDTQVLRTMTLCRYSYFIKKKFFNYINRDVNYENNCINHRGE